MKHARSIRMVPVAVAAAAVSFAVSMPAGAQALNTLVPPKQVVIIVPNAAAGPSDLLARWISPKLSESLKQNVIVDNKPSANGVTAGEFVARAAADGSVKLLGGALEASNVNAVEQMVSAGLPRFAISTLSWILHDVQEPQSPDPVITRSTCSTYSL